MNDAPLTRRERRLREEQLAVQATPADPAGVVVPVDAAPANVTTAIVTTAIVAPAIVSPTFDSAVVPAVPVATVMRAPRAAMTYRPALPAAKSEASRATHHAKPARTKATRRLVTTLVMTAAAGLIATVALPAYAFSTEGDFAPYAGSSAAQFGIGQQTLQADSASLAQQVGRDDYQATTQQQLDAKKKAEAAAADAAALLKLSSNSAITASDYPSVVAPEVQALAAQLMDAVASGKLRGSRPDHIKEIQYLADGQVVPGCGVDYRVLQTIKVAVDNFSTVGVSDINRLCTGQLEGAGTISPHYRNGGGHAVDFYILNGHSLTGGDADSMKLLRLLDPIVPANTNVGQAGCRASGSGFANLSEFDDGCSHLHIDFISARGPALSGI